jgi:hypothetical protein
MKPSNEEKLLILADRDLQEAIRLAEAGDGRNAPIDYCKIRDSKRKLAFLLQFDDPEMERKHKHLFYYRDKVRCHSDPEAADVAKDIDVMVIFLKSGERMRAKATCCRTINGVTNIQSYIGLFNFQLQRVRDRLKELDDAKLK